MENIGGGLGFKATLDIDDFNVSAQAMERQIKDFSNSAAQEAAAVEESFQQMAQKAGQYISYYLIGQGMNNLVSSIVSVRGQFQQLELAFGTMLGSTAKATDLMQQMVDTAAKTPFGSPSAPAAGDAARPAEHPHKAVPPPHRQSFRCSSR